MTKTSLTSAPTSPSNKLRRRLLMLLSLLLCAVGTAGCASKSPLIVRPSPPVLEPPPPELMKPVQPNLRQRLEQVFTPSPRTATPPSGS